MRKPCFACDYSGNLKRVRDCSAPCDFVKASSKWEDCIWGAKDEEYQEWLKRQNQAQCPCCKGSGFIPKEGSIVDEIRALEWYHNWCPICQNKETHGHATGCEFAAILRRLK